MQVDHPELTSLAAFVVGSEAHHGRLWATANDGPGATFSFSIPKEHEGNTIV